MQFSPFKLSNRNYPTVNSPLPNQINVSSYPNKGSRYEYIKESEQHGNLSSQNIFLIPSTNKSNSRIGNQMKNSNCFAQQKIVCSNLIAAKPQTPNQCLQIKGGNMYPLANSYELQITNKKPFYMTEQKNSSITKSAIFQNQLNEPQHSPINFQNSINNSVKEKRLPRGSEPLTQNQTDQNPNKDNSHESFFRNYASPKKQTHSLFQSAQIELNKSYDTDEKIQTNNQGFKYKRNIMKRSSIQAYSQYVRDQKIFQQNRKQQHAKIEEKRNKQEKAKNWSVQCFQKIKQLGAGKYGHVFLVRQRQSNYICALKQIEKQLLRDQQITEQFIREIKIQTYLNHPNIIRMLGFFQDKLNIYIILEAALGGQLYHHIKKSECLPQHKVAYYMRQVCDAVKEIHSLRVIHRDIKPENIVLHENVIKLCDFGWSVRQQTTLRTTFCGTPLYVCPQILKGNEYDSKIDIWSLGIMMYEMLVGQNPFNITKEEQLIKIIRDEVIIPSYVKLSKEAEELLYLCLKKDPTKRADIRQITGHEFFKKYPDKQAQKNKMAGF